MFGLSAGFAPGPLLTLIITQTLRHNVREGIWVAVAPVMTDVPIILVSFYILNQLSTRGSLLGLISATGGFYVLCLAYETIRTGPVDIATSKIQPHSLRKGIMVNALNPHPYLFWATVGVPFFLKTRPNNPIAPWLFIFAFYFCLIGSKVMVALIVSRFQTFLGEKIYLYLMRGLGVLLASFAVFLWWDALVHFGLICNLTNL
jgi:threonine/homoserine/homoserine lactone efflux protein